MNVLGLKAGFRSVLELPTGQQSEASKKIHKNGFVKTPNIYEIIIQRNNICILFHFGHIKIKLLNLFRQKNDKTNAR